MEQPLYGFGVRTGLSPEEAEAAVRRAPSEEGSGAPTGIDVAAAVRAKLGAERPLTGSWEPATRRRRTGPWAATSRPGCCCLAAEAGGRLRLAPGRLEANG
jgi:hypothetical protein